MKSKTSTMASMTLRNVARRAKPQGTERIVRKFRHGNAGAFETIFNLLYASIAYFADELVNDRDRAKQLTEEAFETVWENRKYFPSFNAIKTFCYIYVNQSTVGGERPYLNKLPQKVLSFDMVQANRLDKQIEKGIFEAEVLRHISTSLNSLPKENRQVIDLTMAGVKPNQIAERLHLSHNKVLELLKQGMEILRRAIHGTETPLSKIETSHPEQ